MPDKLKDEKIIVNLGNGSYYGQQGYIDRGYSIINTVESIGKAVNKKQCLITFKENGLPTLDMIDLNTSQGVAEATLKIEEGKALVYKPRHEVAVVIKTQEELKDWIYRGANYVTVFIDKKEQYRVNILCGNVFEVKKYQVDVDAENPEEGGERGNCAWVEKARLGAAYPKSVASLGLAAASCIGLGLTGVDILIDEEGKPRLIELNSAPSLDTTSVQIFYKMLLKLKKNLRQKPRKIKNRTIKATIKTKEIKKMKEPKATKPKKAKKNEKHLLFIYGTLRKRGWNNRRYLSESTLLETDAHIDNAVMYMGKSMVPAISHGKGIVTGELWEVDTKALHEIYALEGYYPEREKNTYTPEKVAVTAGNRKYDADAFFGDGKSYGANPIKENLVKDGDFIKEIIRRGFESYLLKE